MGCAGASCWNQRKFGARSGGRTRIPFRMRDFKSVTCQKQKPSTDAPLTS